MKDSAPHNSKIYSGRMRPIKAAVTCSGRCAWRSRAASSRPTRLSLPPSSPHRRRSDALPQLYRSFKIRERVRRLFLSVTILGALFLFAPAAVADDTADTIQQQIDSLKNEIDKLKIQLNNRTSQKNTR